MGRTVAAWTVLAGCIAACSRQPADAAGDAGTDAAPSDASTADAGGRRPPEPTPPDIPWLAEGAPPVAGPSVAPCPPGWRELASEEPDVPVTCDAYPEGGPQDCGAGEVHLPGSPACAPLGSGCPDGDWPDGLPEAGVIHVRPGAPAGGDGSRERPFGSVRDALAAAPPGGVVALAKGRYAEPLRPRRPVSIVGACAAETLLAPGALGGALAAVELDVVGRVALRELAVADSPGYGLFLHGARTEVELRGVEIVRATALGIGLADGARLVADGLAVRITRAAADGSLGRALELSQGSSAELSHAALERNRGVAALVTDGSALVVADSVVRDTLGEQRDGAGGRGLEVSSGASAQLERVLLARNRDVGILADGADSRLALSDAVVRDTEGQTSDGAGGPGIEVQDGASAQLERVLVERNREAGVFVTGEGATLALTDAVVRDTDSERGGEGFGRGLFVEHGARVEATRCFLTRNREAGIYASHPTAAAPTLRLSDVVVRDTRSLPTTRQGGAGIVAELGATLEAERTLVEGNRTVGVYVSDEGTSATLADLAVRDTLSDERDASDGIGLAVRAGARATVRRALLERSRHLGLYGHGRGTSLELQDVVVRDTTSQQSDGVGGRGLEVDVEATAEVTRLLVERCAEAGILAGGRGARVRLLDVLVREVRYPDCVVDTTCERPAVGLGAYLGGLLEAESFDVEDAELCGVQLALDGAVDLRSGLVHGSAVGACVQVDGYDLARLDDEVAYHDNGVNLQATSYPVPAQAPGLDDL